MPAAAQLRALAPAAALALFSLAAGTFAGGASAWGVTAGHGVLLAAALYGAAAWRDPLRLGRAGRWLAAALVTVLVASWAASPVGRAGLVAVLTLPAWLLAPAAVARCWRDERARRTGVTAVAAVVLAVAVTALVGRLVLGDARAAAPLGHHNLLAVWLLTLLPLALGPTLESGAARRAAGLVAGGAGLAALALTGSLSGLLGLAVTAVVAGVLLLRRSLRTVLATLAVLAAAAALALPRLLTMTAGADPSSAARRTYWAAGWRGLLERPFLGWGPGAVPWTLGEWMRPVPGVNPPGQVVGDLHALPLQLAYELGGTGLLLATVLAALFAARRWRRAAAAPLDGVATAAALLGLLAAGTALLAVAPLTVTAVPAALAVAAGAALSGEASTGAQAGGEPSSWRSRWPVAVYAALALLALGRLDLAHWHHDRSLSADGPGEVRELTAAVRLDPALPLYRARLAGLEDDAAAALAAAEAAPGAAALWLAAGSLGAAAGEPWTAGALERACVLDPLSAAAPFLLAAVDPAAPAAPRRAARALLAEPRLAAAVWFEGREELLSAALEEVGGWPGVSAGWRRAMVDAVTGWDVEVPGEVARLALVADGGAAGSSLSLHVFRRRPRRLVLAGFEVRRELARQVALPAAATLPETLPMAFAPDLGCASSRALGRFSGSPQFLWKTLWRTPG